MICGKMTAWSLLKSGETERGIKPGDYLKWRGIVQQCTSLKQNGLNLNHELNILNENDEPISINNIKSKVLYNILMQSVICNQSDAQIMYSRIYNIDDDEWKLIYLIPGRCTKDNKLREIQYKILQRFMCLNPLLTKIGIIKKI